MKKLLLAIPLLLFAGCSTEITVNGNNNSIDTSPAKYAGYGSTVDVLKGMSLPSLSLGGSKDEAATDESKATPEAVTETSVEKTTPATVETPTVSVTEDKVTIKPQAAE